MDHTGQYNIILDHIGTHGTIQGHKVTYMTMQDYRGPNGTTQDHMGPYSHTGPYGAIWGHLGPYWAIQGQKGPYRAIGAILVLMGSNWPCGAKWDHTGPYGAIQGHTRPYKAIWVHKGPYGTIQNNTEPYMAIGLGLYLLQGLQVQQLVAARLVCGFGCRFWSRRKLLAQVGWLSIRQIVHFHTVLQAYNIIAAGKPAIIQETISTQYPYLTRNATNERIRFGETFRAESSLLGASFKYRAVKWYNQGNG